MKHAILNSTSKVLYDDNIGWVSIQTLIQQAKQIHKDKKYIVSLSTEYIDGFVDWLGALIYDIPLHQWMRSAEYEPDESKTGFIHIAFTSGTTGYPKKIEHPLSAFYYAAEDVNSVLWKDDGAVFGTAPSSSNSTVSLAWLPALISNRNLVLKRFNIKTWKHDVENYGISFHPGPEVYPRMLQFNKEISNTKTWKTLKTIAMGASIIKPGTFAWWKEHGVTPYNIYGSTEVPAISLVGNDDNWLNITLPSTEVRVDKETNVLELKRRGQTEWWYSNDIVAVDPKNGFKIIGRTTTQLKYRNIRVCPEQYESLAKSVQGVVNAGLTVRNDNLVLFYEGESNLENQIIESVNKYVNEFAFLKIVKHIEKLPTNHLGKISRKEMDDL